MAKTLSAEQILAAFKEARRTYERFTDFCHNEIETNIKERGIWYQVVQGRTKTEDSLTRKLQAETVKVKSIFEIRDLSGIRVITYIDPELNKIQELLWWSRKIGRLKVLRMEGAYRDPGFFGKYVTLSLDESDSEGLPEEFKGLKCELQLTTILQHSWAEVYHQSVRSQRDKLKDLSEEQLQALERKYEEMVKGPLREAADNLHFLYGQANKLKTGVDYKLEDPVSAIAQATNLNELLEGLKAVEDAIERFGGLIPSLSRALPILVSYKPLVSSLPNVPKIVSGMEFKGATKTYCLKELIKVTRLLGYTDVGVFLKFLLEVWQQEPELRSDCESQLREFLEWNIRNLRYWGYAAHLEIATQLDSLFAQATQDDLKFFLLAAEHLLKFQLAGAWESNLNQISVPMGCIRIDEDLANIRQKALGWLRKIASEAKDTNLKLHALRSLFHAVHSPSLPQGSIPEVNELVKHESDELIDSFVSQIPESSYSELLHLAEESRNLEYWYEKEGLSSDKAKGLRSRIESDERYIKFQELVGTIPFTGDFNQHEKIKDERNIHAKKLGLKITASNWKEWKKLILEICSFQRELGTNHFDAFEELLKGMCEVSPELAMELVKDNIEILGRFASRILYELFERESAESTKPILLSCLREGTCVSDVAHGIFWSKKVNAEFVLEAISSIDLRSFPDSIGILIENLLRRESLSSEAQEKILSTIEKLSEIENFSWFRLFFKDHAKALNSFSSEQWRRLLLCLAHHPRLDYHVEELLLAAAEKDSVPVLDFLLERLKVGRNREDRDHFFEAHPRHMNRLASVLERDSEKVTKRLIEEFIGSDYIGRQFYAGALLAQLVHLNSATLTDWLNSLADSKVSSDHELLMEALAPFGNTVLAHPFYKRLIANKHCNRKLWKDVASKLLLIESYNGDDGGLIQLKAFASSVSSWQETDELIKQFKEKFAEIAKTSIEGEDERLSRERSSRTLDYEMRTGKKPKKAGNE